METTILKTDSPERFQVAAQEAARRLRQGEAVVLPTETVYGLAANALDPEAVRRVFAIKSRPAVNPLIVHVASMEMARQCSSRWDERAEAAARAFWPGPLTLVLPKASIIPSVTTAGGSTAAIRWPAHPFIREAIRQCGFPLAAPSANISSGLSPTTAAHAFRTLGGRVSLIVDGGAANVGIESTVLDLASARPAILRPGMITAAAIEAVIGPLEPEAAGPPPAEGPRRSPGWMAKHYAPRARLVIASWRDAGELRQWLEERGHGGERVFVIAHTALPSPAGFADVSVIPRDAEAFARALYAELHRCDEGEADLIVVEEPPDSPEWRPILDRLRRAAVS